MPLDFWMRPLLNGGTLGGRMASSRLTSPTFALKSADSSVALEFSGDVPANLNDWDGSALQVTLSGGAVQASVNAYDVQLHHWGTFFAELASNWHSLDVPLQCGSIEGHVHLTANVDRLGHVALRVRLRGISAPTDWLAEDVVALEAGQLDSIAARARSFFGAPSS